MTTQWTPQQWEAISLTGRNLLVSAAAGSGKTAVLSERCVHLVCDADPRCNLDELLVVTFTEKAASEMKDRIHRALRRRLEQTRDPRIAEQVAMADRTHIGTLHGFCARLLRQHFHLLGLDPNFTILDPDEAELLRMEVVRELFMDRYEADSTGEFQRFIDAYGDGRDERLMGLVVSAHELLCSLVDPEGWRQHAQQRLLEAAERPLRESELGRQWLAELSQQIAALGRRAREAQDAIRRMEGFDKYVAVLDEWLSILRHWYRLLREEGLDALAEEVSALKLPNLPSIRGGTPGREVAKAYMDDVRKRMTQGSLAESLLFSETDWREGFRKTLPHAQVFLQLIEEFAQRYRQAKDAARTLDFSDLERLTLQVLREPSADGRLIPSATARVYHHHFKHVLVDECQDINAVQGAILTLISHECVQGEPGVVPNLFNVGDVKQSIYRFRLADPGQFIERMERYASGQDASGQVIALQRNFRSRAPLLGALNRVFVRLMSKDAAELDYDDSHALHPGAPYPEPGDPQSSFRGAPIELHLLPSKIQSAEGEESDDESSDDGDNDFDRTAMEATLLAQRIAEMMGGGGKPRMQIAERAEDGRLVYRPLRYGDIVILLRALRFKADQFADVLRRAGIPVHAESGRGYFESMEVRDIIALLQVLDNQQQDVPMAALLRSPLAGLPHPEDALATIRLAYADPNDPVPFHQAVVRYAREKDDDLAARLRDLLANIADWRRLAHFRPVAEVIWTIYTQTGYLAFCAGLIDGEQRTANLIHLHERARQFGTFQRQGLYRFLRFLESLRAQKDVAQPSTASEADDVVRIMSIHSAKGLEFPVVLLPDLGKRHNLKDCSGSILVNRQAYLGLAVADEVQRVRYPSLALQMVKQTQRRQTLAEELRLLYVAMTRAREHLILVGTCADSALEKWMDRWSGHMGAMPADDVLASRTMLDWIGPVAAMTANDDEPVFQVTQHTSEEIQQWPNPEALRPAFTDQQKALADLAPLDPPPAPNAAADELIRRLCDRYPYEEMTTVPAATSVTMEKMAHRATEEGWTTHAPGSNGREVVSAAGHTSMGAGGAGGSTGLSSPLPLPRCISAEPRVSATDRGTATHLLLQYLDFTRPCTRGDVRAQIEELLSRKIISDAQAKMIDLNSVEWFLQSELGRLIKANAGVLRREQTIYLAQPPANRPDATGLDQVMIRGRLDLLVPTSEGWVIVDYKTDNVTLQTIGARVEIYRPQVDLYRKAIETITHQPVAAAYLVFLTPRIIESCW